MTRWSAGRSGSLAPPSNGLPVALARAGSVIEASMRAAVGTLSPDLQRTVAYHLGWCDAVGRTAEGNGGKAVRPAIALTAARAVGGREAAVIPGAVALELVHNFSLVHDDVMDGDRERRHRPTVWALFGVGAAILAGDAMLTLAHQVLLDDARPQGRRASSELAAATAEMIQGQAEDLAFEARVDVTEEQCLDMTGHKTAALLACAGAVGAILGGGDGRAVIALRAFGRQIGLAFQAVDDVLGIWGRPDVTGKPVASDLRQHKKTLPVVHALVSGGPGSAELSLLLSNGKLDGESAVETAVAILESAGSREWALALAERHLSEAITVLDGAGLEPGPVEELWAIGEFIARRES